MGLSVMRQRLRHILFASLFLFLWLGCDGFLRITGSLQASRGDVLSGCEARIESMDGQVYLDWRPIDPKFEAGTVVPPFEADYVVSIRCPGYTPVVRTISWGEKAKRADLGLIVLSELD